MLVRTDDFMAPFEPCPTELVSSTAKAQLVIRAASRYKHKDLTYDEMIDQYLPGAPVYLFTVGLQFYGMSRWRCNDYIPVYGFSGDAFKIAADGFALSYETELMAVYSYGRAGHCYRAANEYRRATFCFFRAYELSIALRRPDLTGYFCAEGWKIILDRWLLLPKVVGLSEQQVEVESFLLRLSGFDFQWLVWYLLCEEKFEAEVGKQTHDGGIDLSGAIDVRGKRRSIIVQCKNPQRRNKKVAVSAIRELLGVYMIHKPHRLMFFTTTDFTAAAIKTAEAASVDIELVNGRQIFDRLQNVYSFDVYSADVADRDFEERTGILKAADRAGMPAHIVNISYEHQQRISDPFYMNAQLNEWLQRLENSGLAIRRSETA